MTDKLLEEIRDAITRLATDLGQLNRNMVAASEATKFIGLLAEWRLLDIAESSQNGSAANSRRIDLRNRTEAVLGLKS